MTDERIAELEQADRMRPLLDIPPVAWKIEEWAALEKLFNALPTLFATARRANELERQLLSMEQTEPGQAWTERAEALAKKAVAEEKCRRLEAENAELRRKMKAAQKECGLLRRLVQAKSALNVAYRTSALRTPARALDEIEKCERALRSLEAARAREEGGE